MNYFRFIYIYLYLDINLGFSGSSASKESTCNAGNNSLISGSGRSTGEGIGYPLQYSWVSLVAQTVKIPLQCGRPGFDPWVRKIPWRRAWQPTPVFLPGETSGQRSLAGYSPRGCKESDTIEWLSTAWILIWLLKSYLPIYITKFHFIIDRNGNAIEHLFSTGKKKRQHGGKHHIGGLPWLSCG